MRNPGFLLALGALFVVGVLTILLFVVVIGSIPANASPSPAPADYEGRSCFCNPARLSALETRTVEQQAQIDALLGVLIDSPATIEPPPSPHPTETAQMEPTVYLETPVPKGTPLPQ